MTSDEALAAARGRAAEAAKRFAALRGDQPTLAVLFLHDDREVALVQMRPAHSHREAFDALMEIAYFGSTLDADAAVVIHSFVGQASIGPPDHVPTLVELQADPATIHGTLIRSWRRLEDGSVARSGMDLLRWHRADDGSLELRSMADENGPPDAESVEEGLLSPLRHSVEGRQPDEKNTPEDCGEWLRFLGHAVNVL